MWPSQSAHTIVMHGLHMHVPLYMCTYTCANGIKCMIFSNLTQCFKHYCINTPTNSFGFNYIVKRITDACLFSGRIIIAFLCQSSLHCRLCFACLLSRRSLWLAWALEALARADAQTMIVLQLSTSSSIISFDYLLRPPKNTD